MRLLDFIQKFKIYILLIISYEIIVHLFSKKSPENPGGFSEKSPVPRGFECFIPRPHPPSRVGPPGDDGGSTPGLGSLVV